LKTYNEFKHDQIDSSENLLEDDSEISKYDQQEESEATKEKNDIHSD
jgi:hypothetical protein